MNKISKIDFEGQQIYVGMDVHKKRWSISILTEKFEHKTFTQPPDVGTLVNFLKRDNSWLSKAKGKAVKVVAQLLAYLPRIPDLGYRVIFMGRDIEEVLSSQKSMLKRQDRQGAKLSDDRLRAVFVHQVRQAVSNRQDYKLSA